MLSVILDFSEHETNVKYFINFKNISLLSKILIYSTETNFDKVGSMENDQ